MARKKKKNVFKSYLRKIRIEKGFKKMSVFAQAFAEHAKLPNIKSAASMISRWETLRGKPTPENLKALVAVLKLTPQESKSLNRSIGKAGMTKKKATKKTARKRAARNSTVVAQPKTPQTKQVLESGIITTDAAEKFSKAIAAMESTSLECAKKMLEDLATK